MRRCSHHALSRASRRCQAVLVDIDAACTQCSKALLRSHVCDSQRFVDPAAMPTGGQVFRAVCGDEFGAGGYDMERTSVTDGGLGFTEQSRSVSALVARAGERGSGHRQPHGSSSSPGNFVGSTRSRSGTPMAAASASALSIEMLMLPRSTRLT